MPARIRVLCVVDNLEVGGTREIVLSQLASLDSDRFEPGLLTLADDLGKASELLPNHVTQLAARYRRDYGFGALDYLSDGVLLRAARRFGRDALGKIDRFGPRILHFHTNPRELGLGILANRRTPRALVFTDHLVRIRSSDYSRRARFLLRISYRRLYRHFHTISVGPTVAQLNREAGFLNPSREHLLLENQVDLRRFRPPTAARPDRPLEIIYIGRIHHVKGLDTLIRAFGQLEVEEPVRLVLVGPDAMGGAMQRLAEGCVDPPLQVQFLGARTDVPSLLHRASIGVLPSRREGLPMALLEMMATALPVVVSDIPENADIVSGGVNGLVVPMDDADALAAALRMLVLDRELRTRLGQTARESAEARMKLDTSAELARFYESVALGG
jgi:glycosyltransferase involved in cell wall biosynthesis